MLDEGLLEHDQVTFRLIENHNILCNKATAVRLPEVCL